MYNDMTFQMILVEKFKGDEIQAFRWLFTPVPELNHRTPIEVISDGGKERVFQMLEAV
jgi:uncharacterized protein (DUF2384 family)